MRHPLRTLSAIFLLATFMAPQAQAAEFEVLQKNKAFSLKKLKIKLGDSVNFRNDDSFFHNVFSLSDTKTFDLGSYPQGQSKKVLFDKAGTIEVECSIHPEMKLIIEVTP